MNLIRGILGIIIIVYIRIWIINNAFKYKKIKRDISINIFLLSLILVCFLYFYKDILIFLNIGDLYLLQDSSWRNMVSFIIYCFSFIILLTLSFGNIIKNKSIKFIVVSLLLFLGIGIGGSLVGINILIMYYVVSSYAEEILKFNISQNIFLEKKNNISKDQTHLDNKRHIADLVFFAILAGLGFSVIENIFYLVVSFVSKETNLVTNIGRGIFATMIHIVATGLIAFFSIRKQNKKHWFSLVVGILAGFSLHTLYNLTLAYEAKIFTVIIFIVCYFILSYLLFNSDLIYQKK